MNQRIEFQIHELSRPLREDARDQNVGESVGFDRTKVKTHLTRHVTGRGAE